MRFDTLPAAACWSQRGLRVGFEVVYFLPLAGGWRADGTATALQDDDTCVVSYDIQWNEAGRTQSARVLTRTEHGSWEAIVASDGAGRWTIAGQAAEHLDGCLDVDLEASAMTNALPVRRHAIQVGQQFDAPAAYIRLGPTCRIERLQQHYRRVDDDGARQQYEYAAPLFDFRCTLTYDEHGLVVTYPGLADRVR